MITDILESAVRSALCALDVEPMPESIKFERPANRDHGDWSSNVALASAKPAGRNPRELGQEIASLISAAPPQHVRSVEVAGPGFVNFRLDDSWLYDVVPSAAADGPDRFGRSRTDVATKVNIEFVSANPTGPLHAGHARGACYGDAVASLLQAVGHEVEREFYINDRGVQMKTFADSLVARKAGEDVADDGYAGQYIIDWAEEMPLHLSEEDALEWGYDFARADQVEVLASLGIHFDTWYSERSMVENGKVEEALADLRARGVVYEEGGATWLRSSDFGDDKDRVLIKSDGSYTYLTPDISYHRDKFSRADRLVNVWGADHHGYVPRMKAAMQALGHDADELEIVITQLVKLIRGGEEVKLSKRTGDLIELRDIIDEIGADATRFTYLLSSVDSPQTFDLELAASQGMDNPVYYVQMAHARLRSIQAKVEQAGVAMESPDDVDLAVLTHERELELVRQLHEFSDLVALAARERAPHKLANWLRDFAAAVHGFYHDCYVLGDDVAPELTQARLWLVEAARVGLAAGLGLLGVTAPDSM